YGYVAMEQRYPLRPVLASGAAEQENRRHAQGYRYDGRAEIFLVLVLMQGQAAAGHVAVDQAGVRFECRKGRLLGGVPGQRQETLRHGRPWLAAVRINGRVSIAASIA